MEVKPFAEAPPLTRKYYSDYPKRDYPEAANVAISLRDNYNFEPDTIYETPTSWLVYNPYTKANRDVVK
jgi:hypothetical protein